MCSISEYFYSNETVIDKAFTTKKNFAGFVTVLRALCAIRPLYRIIESHRCENICTICGLRRIIESRVEPNSPLDYEIAEFEENFKILIDEKSPEEILTYFLTDEAFNSVYSKKCKLKYEIGLAHGRSIGKILKQEHGLIPVDANELVVPIPDYTILYTTLPSNFKIQITNFIESRQSLIGKITNNLKKTLSRHKYSRNAENYDLLPAVLTASIAPELLKIKINWGSYIPILHQIFQFLVQIPDKIIITVGSAQISYGLRLLFISKDDSTYLIAHGDYWEKIESNSRLLIGNGQWYDNLLFILYTRHLPVMMFYEKGYNQEFSLTDNQLVILESVSLNHLDEIPEKIYKLIVDPEISSSELFEICPYCDKQKSVNEIKCNICGFSFSSWKCSNGHQNWAFTIGCDECGEVKAEVINYRKNYPRVSSENDDVSQCLFCYKQIMPNRFLITTIDHLCKACLIMKMLDQVKIYV